MKRPPAMILKTLTTRPEPRRPLPTRRSRGRRTVRRPPRPIRPHTPRRLPRRRTVRPASPRPNRPPPRRPRTASGSGCCWPGPRPAWRSAAYFLVPWVDTALNTVSTDDAYVNGHVTFVAPRVSGQVAKVLVDDNHRVKKGDLLVQLDKEPFQVQVASEARRRPSRPRRTWRRPSPRPAAWRPSSGSQRWKLQNASEQVDAQVAHLRSQVAALRSQEATLDLARGRVRARPALVADVGRQPGGLRPRTSSSSGSPQAAVTQAREAIYQTPGRPSDCRPNRRKGQGPHATCRRT